MKQEMVINRLEKGDVVLLVRTGHVRGYSEYYRFLSDGETLNSKTFWALKNKGMEIPVIDIPEKVAIMKGNRYSSYSDSNALETNKAYLSDEEDDLDPAGGRGLYSHI